MERHPASAAAHLERVHHPRSLQLHIQLLLQVAAIIQATSDGRDRVAVRHPGNRSTMRPEPCSRAAGGWGRLQP